MPARSFLFLIEGSPLPKKISRPIANIFDRPNPLPEIFRPIPLSIVFRSPLLSPKMMDRDKLMAFSYLRFPNGAKSEEIKMPLEPHRPRFGSLFSGTAPSGRSLPFSRNLAQVLKTPGRTPFSITPSIIVPMESGHFAGFFQNCRICKPGVLHGFRGLTPHIGMIYFVPGKRRFLMVNGG